MTATERLFRGDEDEYLSMDDPRDYGNIIYQLSFKEAINSKPPIISDYKVITFGISEPEIEEVYKSNKYIQVQKEIKDITAREFATAIALRKAIKKLKISNAISFHRSILRAKNFRQQQELITKIYPDYQPIKTFHVSGTMPTNQRSSQMRLFAESKGLMTNARCLTEGVDLPAIDCVCFTDPKKSRVDIVQAAGRALRLSKGKKFGYILIPIFVSKNQDPNEAAKDSGFEEVIATVGALSTQDTRIADYLRGVAEGTIPRGGNPIDGITKVNVLTEVDSDVFEKSIKLKVWNKIAHINYRSYEEARKFVHKLDLKSVREWGNYCHNKFKDKPKKPFDIPTNVSGYYRGIGVWKGYGDFLGTGKIADHLKVFWSFSKARNFLHKLKFKKYEEYETYCEKGMLPVHIPSSLVTYKSDARWKGSRDFVGVSYRFGSKFLKYLPYKKARKFVHKLKLITGNDWHDYINGQLKTKMKRPQNIPMIPKATYKNKGWKGWKDWIGPSYNPNWKNEEIKKSFLGFVQARKFVQKLKLKNINDWKKFAKSKDRPAYIPTTPYLYTNHKNWKGLEDFIGTKIDYLSFKKARRIVHKLKLRSKAEYVKFKLKDKKYTNIPTYPYKIYRKKGWKDWKDWIGSSYNTNWQNENRTAKLLDFHKAKKFIKRFKLKGINDWRKFKNSNRRPKFIPMNPYFYKRHKDWKGLNDFLGTG